MDKALHAINCYSLVIKHLSLDNLPPFYHTLLKYWQEYNHNKFNYWLVGGKPIFYKPLFQITSIKHLLNENNTFLSFDELQKLIHTLLCLITSIPTELLRNQNNCSQTVLPLFRLTSPLNHLLFSSKQSNKSSYIREQNLKLWFHQRKYSQSVYTTFLDNQRF